MGPEALHAEAGDHVGHEKRQPAHDKDAHHHAQGLGGLLLLGELGQLPAEVEPVARRHHVVRDRHLGRAHGIGGGRRRGRVGELRLVRDLDGGAAVFNRDRRGCRVAAAKKYGKIPRTL